MTLQEFRSSNLNCISKQTENSIVVFLLWLQALANLLFRTSTLHLIFTHLTTLLLQKHCIFEKKNTHTKKTHIISCLRILIQFEFWVMERFIKWFRKMVVRCFTCLLIGNWKSLFHWTPYLTMYQWFLWFVFCLFIFCRCWWVYWWYSYLSHISNMQ